MIKSHCDGLCGKVFDDNNSFRKITLGVGNQKFAIEVCPECKAKIDDDPLLCLNGGLAFVQDARKKNQLAKVESIKAERLAKVDNIKSKTEEAVA